MNPVFTQHSARKTPNPGFTENSHMHWRPAKGMQAPTPEYQWRSQKLNAGWVTTFNEFAVVSENRVTPVPADIDRRSAPLLGCAVTTARGVVNNDAQIAIGESVLVLGAGGVGLNIVQFAAMAGAYQVIAVDRLENKLKALVQISE